MKILLLVIIVGVCSAQTLSRYETLVMDRANHFAEEYRQWVALKNNLVAANGKRPDKEREQWQRVKKLWEPLVMAVEAE